MKKLLLINLLLMSITSTARVTDIDFVEGKLILVEDGGNGYCGQQGMLIIKTKNTMRMIYEYRHFKAKYYEKYLGFNIIVVYNESVSKTLDCNAGIKDIRSAK